MSQSMATQLVGEVSNENDIIDVQVPERGLDFEVDIRNEELTMLEGESGRLFLQTPEADVTLEVVPSINGATVQPAEAVDTATLTELEPADPAEQPDVESADANIVRMD